MSKETVFRPDVRINPSWTERHPHYCAVVFSVIFDTGAPPPPGDADALLVILDEQGRHLRSFTYADNGRESSAHMTPLERAFAALHTYQEAQRAGVVA